MELLRRQVEEQQRVIKEAMAQLEERDVECSMLVRRVAVMRGSMLVEEGGSGAVQHAGEEGGSGAVQHV